ncbi:MAG: hypothetical protein HY515_00045 [Candidatus Aenigmarchaeota archaeon]|nr:hypothetical protein [Candidatus Aenigmarchaeota archaeon]
MKNRLKHKSLLPALLAVLVLGALFFAVVNTGKNTDKVPDDLKSKFAVLSLAGTNLCAAPGFIDYKNNNEHIQGSCCSAMVFHRYVEQIEGLKKYSGIEKIPSDPYDITVPLARELIDYQKSITLTLEQQEIYDEAVQMSHEGGPCCCKCWRWYAFEGLAKYLITEHDFSAEQVAEVWDLEDGCGGEGHAHQNMDSEVGL